METQISLPWWLLAALLFTLGLFLLVIMRQHFSPSLNGLVALLQQGQRAVAHWLEHARARLQQHLYYYDTQLASMRLHLSLLDFERQFRHQQQRIAKIHSDLRNLVDQMLNELRTTRLDISDAPQWTAAVDAVTSLPVAQQGEAIRDILAQIQVTAMAQQREALREYRWVMGVRNRTLASSRAYWKTMLQRCAALDRALRNLDRHVNLVSEGIERYDAHRDGKHQFHRWRVILHFVLSLGIVSLAVRLASGGGTLFASALQDSGLEPALVQQIVIVYGVTLLLLGAIFSTAMRWSALILPLAELDLRPRRYVAILSGFALVVCCVFAATPLASPLRQTLLESGWSLLSSYLVSTQLWLLPLLVSLQALVLERLVRVCAPVFWLGLVLGLTGVEKILALLHHPLSRLLVPDTDGQKGEKATAPEDDNRALSDSGD